MRWVALSDLGVWTYQHFESLVTASERACLALKDGAAATASPTEGLGHSRAHNAEVGIRIFAGNDNKQHVAISGRRQQPTGLGCSLNERARHALEKGHIAVVPVGIDHRVGPGGEGSGGCVGQFLGETARRPCEVFFFETSSLDSIVRKETAGHPVVRLTSGWTVSAVCTG